MPSSFPARRRVVAVAVAAIGAVLALKFLTYSYIAIFLFGAALCAYVARHSVRAWKYVFGNAAVLLVALAIIESVLAVRNPAIKYVESGGPLTVPDRDLGYVARPNASVRQKRYDGGRLTYDATYDIDQNGRRRMPSVQGTRTNAVVLFGCSLIFGVGVNDGDAFPAQLQGRLDDHTRVVSLALAGYGPHQVLRQLETHRDASAIQALHPDALFYAAIPDHVHRAAGRSTWESGGPHYEPDTHGNARFVGAFAARTEQWDLVRRLFRKCQIWSVLTDRRRWPTSEHDLDRFIAIVASADRIVRERYQRPLIFISLWGNHPEAARVAKRLRERGVVVVPVEDIIQDYDAHEARYEIPRDGHFNPFGNARFAEGVRGWLERYRRDATASSAASNVMDNVSGRAIERTSAR
jgi:hypothetical protein